jgi:hypothetical protein
MKILIKTGLILMTLLNVVSASAASGGNVKTLVGRGLNIVQNGNEGEFLLLEESKTGQRRYIYVNQEVADRYIGENEIVLGPEIRIQVQETQFGGQELSTYLWLMNNSISELRTSDRALKEQYALASNFINYLRPVRQTAVMGETRGCPGQAVVKDQSLKCSGEVRNGVPWQCVDVTEMTCP